MSDFAIRVENLSKQYHIGRLQENNDRLGDKLVDIFRSPARRVGGLIRGRANAAANLDETIWALKNVSLEIKHGELVGIIGRNGAGKSTLLKILSQITEPTEGRVRLRGRVGSLLEVGTGFHQELTGRENVYLNGAILGMGKTEISRKFDEIVAFAEIEKFIDTPVKHYSSGMYVRLAFSVAAHLEPEILLVDEVLAVGDVAFQRKCLGKMDDVSQEGRTVLFVSHNMGLVQALCNRGIFLHQGQVSDDGLVRTTVDAYLQSLETANKEDLDKRMDRRGKGDVHLISVEINGGDGKTHIQSGQPVRFGFSVDNLVPGLACDFFIHDSIGQPLAAFRNKSRSQNDFYNLKDPLRFVCHVNQLLLVPGRYRIDVVITGDNSLQDFVRGAAYIDVEPGEVNGRPVELDTKFRALMPYTWTYPTKN